MNPVTLSALSELSMWEDWQEIVRRSLPDFAASPIYVQQRNQSPEDWERAADYVSGLLEVDWNARTRDAEFGARVVNTRTCGDVTRQWLDSMIEIDFLRRHLPSLHSLKVLDVGAGYGRLAAALRPRVSALACVDAVQISTEISRGYLARFAPDVEVIALAAFIGHRAQRLNADLAINIHSWNECSLASVAAWLDLLKLMGTPWLFTVSHGQLAGGRAAYTSWGGKGESFRPLLEARYDLVAEESLGLSNHPHALWKLK